MPQDDRAGEQPNNVRYVCLGWGSLVWCQKALPVVGAWQLDGPNLPLEFARLSNDGRITLVIDRQGTVCMSLWAEINVPTIDAAKDALAEREGMGLRTRAGFTGYWTPNAHSDHEGGAEIARWAADHDFSGVVWTALPTKSPVTRTNGDYPSERDVLDYLERRTGDERARAEEYIRLAPRPINTRYRRSIEMRLGWTHQGRI